MGRRERQGACLRGRGSRGRCWGVARAWAAGPQSRGWDEGGDGRRGHRARPWGWRSGAGLGTGADPATAGPPSPPSRHTWLAAVARWLRRPLRDRATPTSGPAALLVRPRPRLTDPGPAVFETAASRLRGSAAPGSLPAPGAGPFLLLLFGFVFLY